MEEKTPIEELGLDTRTLMALKRGWRPLHSQGDHRLWYVEELLETPIRDLLNYRNIGPTRVQEIANALYSKRFVTYHCAKDVVILCLTSGTSKRSIRDLQRKLRRIEWIRR